MFGLHLAFRTTSSPKRKPVIAARFFTLAGIILFSTLSSEVFAFSSEACFAQARLPLEKSFCEVKKAGGLNFVRSIKDFKKNPEKTQRLILKRDAERLGINLPTKPSSTEVKVSQTPTPPSNARAKLESCTLDKNIIRCNKEQYLLTGNLRNSQLKAEAFSSHNQLLLPRKSATEFYNQSDFLYLSHIYPIYIHKMLEIGLGDSTMSFTKFAEVFWQNKMRDLDFVDRFQFMYNKLKIEKSRNQVKPRYSSDQPDSINQCMRLDTRIIVCDNKTTNWVYHKR